MLKLIYSLLFLSSYLSCSFGIFSSELFVLPLSFKNFGFRDTELKFHLSLLDKPDLPPWLHFTPSSKSHSGFLFGAPPLGTSSVKLEVIGTDLRSYNISRKILSFEFEDKDVRKNEIQLKIINLNADELLVPFRLDRLRGIIVNDLWKESATDGVFTFLIPASLNGDRLPPRPIDKEGVYVRFGSNEPFSSELQQLELEVMPLWAHRPCPIYFKKTSYERFFTPKGFAVDWCSVKLNVNEKLKAETVDLKETFEKSPIAEDIAFHLLKKADLPSRSYIWDVIYTILIPLGVTIVLLTLLSLAMCCHRTDMLPSGQPIQLVQYTGVNKAFGALRSVRGREYSPHPSTMTATTQLDTTITNLQQVDIVNRSQTDSLFNADSSMDATTQNLVNYPFEDYAVLNRPEPPPYSRNLSFRYDEEDLDSTSDFISSL